jgi:hypothetical protein
MESGLNGAFIFIFLSGLTFWPGLRNPECGCSGAPGLEPDDDEDAQEKNFQAARA